MKDAIRCLGCGARVLLSPPGPPRHEGRECAYFAGVMSRALDPAFSPEAVRARVSARPASPEEAEAVQKIMETGIAGELSVVAADMGLPPAGPGETVLMFLREMARRGLEISGIEERDLPRDVAAWTPDMGSWHRCRGCNGFIGFTARRLAQNLPEGACLHTKPAELAGVPDSVPCELYRRLNPDELHALHRGDPTVEPPAELREILP